jgi:hypothetical protein
MRAVTGVAMVVVTATATAVAIRAATSRAVMSHGATVDRAMMAETTAQRAARKGHRLSPICPAPSRDPTGRIRSARTLCRAMSRHRVPKVRRAMTGVTRLSAPTNRRAMAASATARNARPAASVEAGGDDVAAEGEAAVTVAKRPATVKPTPAMETAVAVTVAVARASAVAVAVAVAPRLGCRRASSTEHLGPPTARDSMAKAAVVR